MHRKEKLMNNEICKHHSGLVQMVRDVKDDTQKQWEIIDKIRNRPPIWCTAVIAILTGLLSAVSTYAALAINFVSAISAAN